MEITLLQGLLIALAVAIIAIDYRLEGFFIFRPIIVCPIIGLIVNDLNTGLIAGGIVELAFAGITPVGGVIPPDAVMCSVMTVVLAKTTGQPVAAAFALAVPFGLLMQYFSTMYTTVLVAFNKKADQYAKQCNIKGIFKLCFWGIALDALMYAAVAFIATYAAQEPLRQFVESMPEWLTHGFDVAGGLLPAIGFAMLLKVMLKGKFVPYLLAGFLFSTFIHFDNILPVAIMGLSFALMDYFKEDKKGDESSGEGI